MRKIEKIFIHHSASNFGNAKLINLWHRERGFTEIGYHFVVLNGFPNAESYKKKIIYTDLIGEIERGRNLEKVGSHVAGHNNNSIGVCLIHNDKPYSEIQIERYRLLVASLALHFKIPIENIQGHYEVDKAKPLCPSLDMNQERKKIDELIHHMPDFARDFYIAEYINNQVSK